MSNTKEENFTGVKIALLFQHQIIVIQRDNKPGLAFAGLWDLPGGGRENKETPISCIQREVKEELGISLSPESIVWQKTFSSVVKPGTSTYFMVAHVDAATIASIKFGDEGQGWKLIDIQEFIKDSEGISFLKDRLQFYLDSQ